MLRPEVEYYPIPTDKDIELSTCFRDEGNVMFKSRNFYHALENYNKSLMFAPPKSDDIALAYANRSAVYMEVKEYDKCIENIKLARDHGYPKEKAQTLVDREERCKKQMETCKPNPDDDPWSFFKLSYPANEKIPFIANCLKLTQDKQHGRGIITNKDLNPGDIIAIEEPLFKTVGNDTRHLRCTGCMRSNKMSLIPHEVSCLSMFCSNECMETATKNFFAVELLLTSRNFVQQMFYEALAICGGSFDKMQELIDDPDLSMKTVFDFDLSDPNDPLYKYRLLLAFHSLTEGPMIADMESIKHFPMLKLLKNDRERNIAKAFTLRIFRILCVNSLGLDWYPIMTEDGKIVTCDVTLKVGSGLLPFGALLNHSCVQNVDRIIVDNKFVFYVRRPILKGQQLFITYGQTFTHMPLQFRQMALKDHYSFKCACEACHGNFPFSMNYKNSLIGSQLCNQLTMVECVRNFRKNCKIIERNRKKSSNLEMCRVMDLNVYYLVAIAKAEPFIFKF